VPLVCKVKVVNGMEWKASYWEMVRVLDGFSICEGVVVELQLD